MRLYTYMLIASKAAYNPISLMASTFAWLNGYIEDVY